MFSLLPLRENQVFCGEIRFLLRESSFALHWNVKDKGKEWLFERFFCEYLYVKHKRKVMAVRKIFNVVSLFFLMLLFDVPCYGQRTTTIQRPCTQSFADDYLYNILKGQNSSYNTAIAPDYPGTDSIGLFHNLRYHKNPDFG